VFEYPDEQRSRMVLFRPDLKLQWLRVHVGPQLSVKAAEHAMWDIG
jgi:hypothetical protein